MLGPKGEVGMRLRARSWLLIVLTGALVALAAPSAAQAAPGIAKFEALTCTENEPEGGAKECNASTPAQFFKQAGGHPNYTEYPGVPHNSWDKAYGNKELYEWLFKQEKK